MVDMQFSHNKYDEYDVAALLRARVLYESMIRVRYCAAEYYFSYLWSHSWESEEVKQMQRYLRMCLQTLDILLNVGEDVHDRYLSIYNKQMWNSPDKVQRPKEIADDLYWETFNTCVPEFLRLCSERMPDFPIDAVLKKYTDPNIMKEIENFKNGD